MHRSGTTLALMVVILAGAASPSLAQVVWHVDDNAPNDPGPGNPGVSDRFENGSVRHPFDRIQEAITAATAGDSVLVEPGTYLERINLSGKAITIVSAAGATSTHIDAQSTGSTITSTQGENVLTIVDGFTVRGGTGTSLAGYPIPNGGIAGGGMFIWNASPTLRNCVFLNNTAIASPTGAGYGGGLAIFNNSNPTITNCTFRHNTAYGAINGYGGGVFASGSSSPTILDCRFELNNAYGHFNGFGGGIGVQADSSPQLTNCVFKDNIVSGQTLYGYGAGAFVGNGGTNNAHFEGCRFVKNQSEEYAGGLYIDSTAQSTAINNCVFDQNTALIGGGAILTEVTNMTPISNSRFCASTPEHIAGTWTDLGGNAFSMGECCPADIDDSEAVDTDDLLILIAVWGNPSGLGGIADINHDGFVDTDDLLVVISTWGSCP